MKDWNPTDIKSIVIKKSDLFEELKSESNDYSCVLLGTSYLDELLASLLKEKFENGSNTINKVLNPSGGALGTFMSRVDVSYCLGLINKNVKADCQIIGEIRNIFAHNYFKTTFKNSELQDKCNMLQFIDTIFKEQEYKKNRAYSDDELALIAKNRFIISLVLLTANLEVEIMSMQTTKIKSK